MKESELCELSDSNTTALRQSALRGAFAGSQSAPNAASKAPMRLDDVPNPISVRSMLTMVPTAFASIDGSSYQK